MTAIDLPDNEVLGCAIVQNRFNLTTSEKAEARNRLMEYPLPQVKYRLEKEGVIPFNLIDEAITEWRKFMSTILFAEGSIGMISPIVDEVWHAFILFTPDYSKFCREVFGHFINHVPNWPGAPLAQGGGQRFIGTYEQLYGELPPIWNAHKNNDVLGRKVLIVAKNENLHSDCDDCGPGVCGVSCYDCNGGNDDDCSTQG